MKKTIAVISALLLLISALGGCKDEAKEEEGASSDTVGTAEISIPASSEEMFTARDLNTSYDEGSAVHIQLNGDCAASDSDSVKISGTSVTLTEDATYIITGTLDDGTIKVDAGSSAKPQLVLCGAAVNSEASAALYILSADKVFVTLAEGTQNSLTNGGAFEAIDGSSIDGAVFSRQDLTFNGSGTLTVVSPAGHAVVCKDDLVFTGGTFTLTSAAHGLDANDSVRIANASLSVQSGKDGIHAENNDDASKGFIYIQSGEITIDAQGDGISAGAYIKAEGGTADITAGGGSENGTKSASDSYGGFPGGGFKGGAGGGRPGAPRASFTAAEADEDSTSMKALKAGGDILITGGSFSLNSADDGVHSNASVTVNGGSFEIKSGDDGFHADETLTVSSGTLTVSESYEGLEGKKIVITGGNISVFSDDDGLNAAGGGDSSGSAGGRDGMFGGGMGTGRSDGSIEISGGDIIIKASGDGLDSNGGITVTGGYIYVVNPTAGDTSVLDSDTGAVITGGIFVSAGSTTMMAQSFSADSTQGVIACTTGTQQAGSEISVQDSAGNTVLSYTAEYTYVLVIISSPDIKKGDTYTLTANSASGSVTAS